MRLRRRQAFKFLKSQRRMVSVLSLCEAIKIQSPDYKVSLLSFSGLVTTRKQYYFVIPVKTGIQYFQLVVKALDTRLRGHDELLHVHQL
jgi:hypothetical protein